MSGADGKKAHYVVTQKKRQSIGTLSIEAGASAGFFSLIETAKANGLEPYAYIKHVVGNIAAADTDETLDALLPWNVS